MRAVVCHGPEDYRLQELPTPQAGPGEVVVKIEVAGICASDVKCYSGAPMFWGDAIRQGYCQAPITAGHEFIGTVVALDDGDGEQQGLQIGDLAISEQIVPCWQCRYCRRGQYHLCVIHDIYGFHTRTPGGFAQYMKFPVGALNHKVPAGIAPEHAALIEPLACSMHAVRRAGIEFGDVVVIAGCGPLGLGMVAYAAMKNPAAIVAIDLADDRLQRARRLGATHTFNPQSCSVVEAIREMTEGYGCDVYIEATGHPAAVEQGLLAIRKAGTFVEFSVFGEPVTTDWTIIGDTKELDIRGVHLGPNCYPAVIQSLESGAVDAGVFLSHQLPLEDFEQGFEMVHAGQNSLKVLLKP
ncbi:MAG: alcohol dehydrogenase catalytic domain-containing protein [Armatimonadetes bacterium]|nr:alcohol dehydrogenase catalytic domain-containing protein [Armatimonadota bacterium]